MAIDLNTTPYYDDFDESKNYLKILFKPGYAVQARELTQLQTSIQKQVSRFGSHVFKDGSIVLNGNTTTTVGMWVSVDSITASSAVGKSFVGQDSGATCKVVAYQQVDSTTSKLFFVYTSGTALERGEDIVSTDLLQDFTVSNIDSYTGNGTLFSIDPSVFFVNGYFAYCQSQTIVLDDPFTKRVGISVTESIVSSTTDETLLDPAQGSYNFAAPGADRVSIDLELTSYDFDPLVSALPTINDFIELARFVDNSLVYKVSSASYSDLDNTLARRTYDESGDYTVKAFAAKPVAHIRGESDKFSLAIGAGKAYVKGYEYETISTTHIDVDRAIETSERTNFSVDVSYGDYFVITTPINAGIDYTSNPLINVVSNGITIGSAFVRHIEYVTTNRYKLFLFNVVIQSDYAVKDITAFTSTTNTWFAGIDTGFYTAGVKVTNAPNRTGIITLPNSYVQTLLLGGSSSTEFESQVQYVTNIGIGGTASITSGTGKTFSSSFVDEYVVVNNATGEVIVPLTVEIVANTTANFTFAQTSIAVTIFAPVTHFNATHKDKTFQTASVTRSITGDRISLGYSDCFAINSIIASNANDPESPTLDVTLSFDFNNGQTDDMYDHGWIQLKTGQTISPQFDTIVISVSYFDQSTIEGFFSVDSYPVPVALDYTEIPSYTSQTGTVYRLADCLDFRPRRANNGTDVIGKSAAFPRTRISFDYAFYLPRVDKLVLTKERKFAVIKGVASETPRVPSDMYDAMTLYVLTLPPYTATPAEIQTSYIDNRRYTMRDIGKIDKRVEKIEYYTALSFLEKQAKDETIYDNLGMERFKNGILVDSFTGHSVGEVASIDYLCSINKESRIMRPRFAEWSHGFVVDTSTVSKVGDLLTLPVSSTEILLEQPYATNSVNVNPYLVFNWNGEVNLNPATDTWIDTQTRPDVIVNLNGDNDVYTSLVSNVSNPASVGVLWNDWQTVVRGVTVEQDISNQLSINTNVIDGKTLETTTNAISSSIATTTESSSYRTGLQLSSSAVSTVQRDLGTKVVDVSIVPYIRSRPVDFAAINMKPSTELVASFDNVNVTSYCTPAVEITLPDDATVPVNATTLRTSGGLKSARIVLARKNTVFVVADIGSLQFASGDSVQWIVDGVASATVTVSDVIGRTTLATNAIGDVAGVFLIPNNDSIKFTTGEKMFRLTDRFGNYSGTAAEVKYVAQGMSQSLQKDIVATRVASVSINPTQETSERSSSTSTSTASSSSAVTIDVTNIPDPIRIMCSKDEDTGDFSSGAAISTEYMLSYIDSVIVSASGSSGGTTITVNDATGIYAGFVASGSGIATGATVISVAGLVVTLSAANTAAVGGSSNVTFTNVFDWVGIKFIPTEQPVRFTIHFDGNQYTTGFIGSTVFNAQLSSLSLPNVVSDGRSGKLFFKRSVSTSTEARLIVDSPLQGTPWQFSVPAPLATDPTVTLPAPTYAIVANKNSCSEGDTVTFNITTSGVESNTVLNWSTTGSVSAGDFVGGAMTGTVTVVNNKGTITRVLANDFTSDGNESFQIVLSSSGTTRATSQTVTVLDTSTTPVATYFVSTSTATVVEGSSVTFNISTTEVPDGTDLFWTLTGGVNTADFTGGAVSGQFTITNNVGTVTLTLASDATTEGTEQFNFQVRTVSVAGTVVATSRTVFISDTSVSVSHTVVPNVRVAYEGSTVRYDVTTTSVPNGTVLYWSFTGIQEGDLVVPTGTVTVNNNAGQFSVTLVEDSTTEGTEYMTAVLKDGSNAVLAQASTVTIIDTSLSAPTYSITPSVTTVNEGSTVQFTIRTTNVPNGTTLRSTLVYGTGATLGDFTNRATDTVSHTINNNIATFTLNVNKTDSTTEDNETFSVNLIPAGTTDVLASSTTVTIVNFVPPVLITAQNIPSSDTVNMPFSTRVQQFSAGISGVNVPSGITYTPQILGITTTTQSYVSSNYITATIPSTPVALGSSAVGNVTIVMTPALNSNWTPQVTHVTVRWTYASGDTNSVIPLALRVIDVRYTLNISLDRVATPVIQDPVAQTFFVDARSYPNGVFVDSVDLFFKTKDVSLPVRVQIRPTVNGYPSSSIILPFATSSLLPSQVSTSADGSIATNFKFSNRVCLAPGEYALVILADTQEYEVFTAILGEFTLADSTKRVDKQPTMGSMFKSQNSTTWTAVQEEDLKFVLHKCVFDNISAEVILNTDISTTNGNVPYDVLFVTGELVDYAATDISFSYNNGGGWIPYQLGTNVTMSEQKTLSTTDPTSLRLKATISTSDTNISPVIDLNRLSSVLVHNIINNDATGEEADLGGSSKAKYVTKKVKLAPGFDATDLKVYFFANVPSASSVKVYYKVSVSTDTYFDDNVYTEMVVENSGSYSENSFVEYKYKTPFVTNDNTTAFSTGDRFDTFSIKIVMLSSDSTKVPLIRDLRVIALDD